MRVSLIEKLVSMEDAASRVGDGARLALGGLSVYQHPMAFVHELVRQRRQNLVVVGVLNGPELDILVGAGCVARVETSYVGLERFGLARNFRRAVESGELAVEFYSELLAFDRFRASEDGLSFAVSKALAGTDVARNERLKPFFCPITGVEYLAAPSAEPDVAVIHAVMADPYGNVLCPTSKQLPQSFDAIVARSTDTVIVTAERIVENAYVRRHPHLTVIPGFRVAAVVEAPFGAHPCNSLQAYTLDTLHFQEYVLSSRDSVSFDGYLNRYVRGTACHLDYLQQVGLERLLSLRTGEMI
jgi:glutaconate CoA-transferase subunit A